MLKQKQIINSVYYSKNLPTNPVENMVWKELDNLGRPISSYNWVYDATNNRWLSENLQSNIVFQNADSFFVNPIGKSIIAISFSYRCFPTNGGCNGLMGSIETSFSNYIPQYNTGFGSIILPTEIICPIEVYFSFMENGSQRNCFAAVNLNYKIIR